MLVNQFAKPTHKRKAEKVQKIKLQERRECWVCHSTQALDPHHCFGAANRPVSEKYGLVVWLCVPDHTGNEKDRKGVHFNKPLRFELKQYAQSKFEEVYSRQEFMDIFKVGNYL